MELVEVETLVLLEVELVEVVKDTVVLKDVLVELVDVDWEVDVLWEVLEVEVLWEVLVD